MLHGWEILTPEDKELIARGIVDGKVYGGPYHIELSPTDNCNYDCFFCNQGFIDRKRSLPIEKLEELIDELVDMGLKVVRLSGGGEPLVHPKIKELLEYLHRYNLPIHNLTTNGYLLTTPIVERLMALPTQEIIVSLNESDAERYGEMMKVRSKTFDRVVKLLKDLIRIRERLNRTDPKLVIQFFVWKRNYRQIDQMVALGKEIGADAVYLRDIWGLSPEKRLNEEEREELLRLVTPLAEKESKEFLGIDFGFEKVVLPGRQERPVQSDISDISDRKACTADRNKYCYIGWYSATIRGNGEVYPCCILQQDPNYPSLGNIHENSFKSIWTGSAYQAFRDELRMIAIKQGRVEEPGDRVWTRPHCVAENECPLLYAMCEEGFYQSMNSQLDRSRLMITKRI